MSGEVPKPKILVKKSGAEKLIYEGYEFVKKTKTRDENQIWRCNFYSTKNNANNCIGKITTNSQYQVIKTVPHNRSHSKALDSNQRRVGCVPFFPITTFLLIRTM